MAVFALFFAALASAAATLLLRCAGSGLFAARLPALIGPWLLPGAALGAYGLGFLAYGFALRELPASLAYPVMTSLALLVTVSASWLWLGEQLGLRALGGIVLLLAGIYLIGTR
ncbi:multidrug efflux SMR transporter [Massilia sp. TS11]|uniref:DMT family transporter n=1 Tax=Massilia sp. TS11 TaxID=2908003 RepID=UPI001EDB94A5|nr:EamA family transporter [Massilia sp. TS11]MCG2585925.1 SMR family transporter [Massilia sp. TS11]